MANSPFASLLRWSLILFFILLVTFATQSPPAAPIWTALVAGMAVGVCILVAGAMRRRRLPPL